MLPEVLALVIASGCTSTTSPRERWGIMAYSGDGPAIYSVTEWRPGTKLRAYRIGRLTESIEVSVAAASLARNSPLFNADGENTSWKHSVAAPQKVPPGATWVCVPTEWTVRPSGPDRAALERAGKEAGSIASALTEEGIEVTMTMGSSSQKLYFYFGYDLSPAPPKNPDSANRE